MKNGVTIGIPVYNEENRIEMAIRSAAPQCERLIVADNASSDATGEVCKRLLAVFPNMEYVRHSDNIGSLRNWFYLLDQVRTPFYLTVGSHDWISPDYAETTKAALERDPEAVLAVGEVCSDSGDGVEPMPGVEEWHGVLGATPDVRVHEFIYTRTPKAWASYGLFRTPVLQNACSQGAFPKYGSDIILLARMAQRGKILVEHGTRYCAWIRKEDSRQNYYERLLGKKPDKKAQKAMREEGRKALFEIYMQQRPNGNAICRCARRFSVMTRLGLFKTAEPDPMFYGLYVPVKLLRAFQRLFVGRKRI